MASPAQARLKPVPAPPALTTGLPRTRTSAAPSEALGTADAELPQRSLRIEGLRALTVAPHAFKVWLLDQFGVLHDGQQAYPDAVEAVRELHAAGVKLIILSNSSRRSDTTLGKLEPMGFHPQWFSGVITSGEIAHGMLSRRCTPLVEKLGDTCIHFTWGSRGAVSLEGLELEVTQDVSKAEFLLAHGTEVLAAGDGEEEVAADETLVRALLKQAAARRLPLIVANPDLVTVSGKELVTMPGTFAKWYAELGGEVDYMGKPARVVYDTAMEIAGVDDKATVVAVGDSLEHDIQGAAEAGMSSVFITSGIHLNDLPYQCLEQNTPMSLAMFDKEVARLATKVGTAVPPFYLSAFRW